MRKTLIAILAAATILGPFGGNAHAEEVTVKEGDSLWTISQKYDVSINEIKKWNELTSDNIVIGSKLEISPQTVSKDKKYIVKSGDTISEIAKQFHVAQTSLKKWNNLKSDSIYIGQKLVIKANDSIANKSSVAKKAASKKKYKEFTVTATAYTAKCKGCSGYTATGFNLKKNPNAKIISVDPKVIPLGSKVYVEGYGYARAEDTGGAIKGKKIDIFVKSKKQAYKWGRKKVKIKIIN